MNADQLKGIWMRFKGGLKQQWDNVTQFSSKRQYQLALRITYKEVPS